MKFVFVFFLFTGFFFNQLSALENTKLPEWIDYEKTYVDPEQVHFDNYDIYLNMEDCLIRVQGVYTDGFGLYFDKIWNEDLPGFVWTCGHCGKSNEDYYDVCRRCGKSR